MLYIPEDDELKTNKEEFLKRMDELVTETTISLAGLINDKPEFEQDKILKVLETQVPELSQYFERRGEYLFRGLIRNKKGHMDISISTRTYKHDSLYYLLTHGVEFIDGDEEDREFFLTEELFGKVGLMRYILPKRSNAFIGDKQIIVGYEKNSSILVIYDNTDNAIALDPQDKRATIKEGGKSLLDRIVKIVIINWEK